MRPVLSVRGCHVEAIADHEDRTAGDIVGEYAEFFAHVEPPDDIAVGRALLDGRLAGPGNVLRLLLEWAIIAVGHAVRVEAQHFASAADEINPVAIDQRRGADAEEFPIADFAGAELGNGELPEELPARLLEAH